MRFIISLGTLFVLLLTGFLLILGSALGLRPVRIQKTNTRVTQRPARLAARAVRDAGRLAHV